MRDVEQLLKRIIEKCDVILQSPFDDDCIISKEELITLYSDYLSQTIDKDNNIGIIMHTGSICFDVLLILYAAVTNICLSTSSVDEIISNLRNGDIVLYVDGRGSSKKYCFEGKGVSEVNPKIRIVKLTNIENSGEIWCVPEIKWKNIVPYYGTQKKMDNRGLRKKNRIADAFYTDVLDYDASDIPTTFSTSTVVLTDKERADFILKNTKLVFNDNEIGLLDLVTATYITDTNELPYKGNQNKADPILKITSKADIAFNTIRDRTGNENIGFLVIGKNAIYRNYTELSRVINLRKLQFAYISVPIDSDYGEIKVLVNEEKTPVVFPCTKELINNYTNNAVIVKNHYTQELITQQHTIVSKHFNRKVVDSDENVNHPLFKQLLRSFKNTGVESETKDEFIIQAYSLWNLFQYTVADMHIYNDLIGKGKINSEPPFQRMQRIKQLSEELPESITSTAVRIIDILNAAYMQVRNKSAKGEEAKEIIKWYKLKKKTAVVFKKPEYRIPFSVWNTPGNSTDIYTVNDFNNNNQYDTIITFGNYYGKKFNPFSLLCAKEIIFIIYDYEIPYYNHSYNEYIKGLKEMHQNSYFDLDAYDDLSGILTESNSVEIEEIDNEILKHINDISIKNTNLFISGSSNYSGVNTEVVKSVTFEDGEYIAFFTKRFKTYCYDEIDNEVKEISVDNISEGDLLIFTKNDSNTRDIVDRIIQELIADEGVDPAISENYSKAKIWKQALRDFMEENSLSASNLINRLISAGITVQEQTIRGWIDEDSHTVKPNDVTNIEIIGRLTANPVIMENPNDYYNSCSVIYKLRTEIRNEIKRVIVRRFGGNDNLEGSILNSIRDEIDSLYDVFRVNTVMDVQDSIPAAATNRPINI